MAGHVLADLAALVGGEVVGDPATQVTGVADPREARGGDMVFLLDDKYLDEAAACAAAVVVTGKARPELPQAQLVVAKPRVAMARLMAHFAPPPPALGRHPTAVVDPTASVDATAWLGPHVTVAAGATVVHLIV